MLSQLQISDLIIIFICILISMGFHEAMHAFVAHWLGDSTAKEEGRLSLNPLKHIDLYTTVLFPLLLILLHIPPFFVAKPVPFNAARVKYDEFGVAIIGVAGPFTNLFLASVISLVIRVFGVGFSAEILNILSIFIIINLGMFVFNMIPFPPLDGSRLLYAFAPEPLQRLMYRIESAGFLFIIAFIFLLFPLIIPAVSSAIDTLYRLLLG